MGRKPKAKRLTADEREAYGKGARRVWLAIKENQQAAGHPVSEGDLAAWEELSEAEREVFRQSGEDMAGGATQREQAFWAELERRRAEMGEKAFREKLYSLCVSIAVEGIAPQALECERQRTVDGIVKMAGMLEVPKEDDENRAGKTPC